MAVNASRWLELMETEYIEAFVLRGGAAIKFAVVESPDHVPSLLRRIGDIAGRHGLLHIAIDSASTRLHLIQDVFFAAARQLDWPGLAQSFVEKLFAEDNYRWPEPGRTATLREIADANATDETIVRQFFRQALTRNLMRSCDMAQDFRIAMMQLCLTRTHPETAAEHRIVAPVIEWLRGDLKSLAALRQAQIFSRITRHNARPMFRSLCHWVRACGAGGLMVSIDIRRIAVQRPAGGGVRYSPAAVLDAYEVLRQLIDETDGFAGLLLVAIGDDAFVDGDTKRSVDAYTALKMRIWSDVRAERLDNPLAPLVVLDGEVAA